MKKEKIAIKLRQKAFIGNDIKQVDETAFIYEEDFNEKVHYRMDEYGNIVKPTKEKTEEVIEGATENTDSEPEEETESTEDESGEEADEF